MKSTLVRVNHCFETRRPGDAHAHGKRSKSDGFERGNKVRKGSAQPRGKRSKSDGFERGK
eukprot:249019-Pleurochrysis_carterae.AAC.1